MENFVNKKQLVEGLVNLLEKKTTKVNVKKEQEKGKEIKGDYSGVAHFLRNNSKQVVLDFCNKLDFQTAERALAITDAEANRAEAVATANHYSLSSYYSICWLVIFGCVGAVLGFVYGQEFLSWSSSHWWSRCLIMAFVFMSFVNMYDGAILTRMKIEIEGDKNMSNEGSEAIGRLLEDEQEEHGE